MKYEINFIQNGVRKINTIDTINELDNFSILDMFSDHFLEKEEKINFPDFDFDSMDLSLTEKEKESLLLLYTDCSGILYKLSEKYILVISINKI